jgi:hypothetical protein
LREHQRGRHRWRLRPLELDRLESKSLSCESFRE